MGRGWDYFVAFPSAQCDCANLQSASGFWLEDFQLEASAPEMTSEGGRFLWDWYSSVI
jgi:hypothetical protein